MTPPPPPHPGWDRSALLPAAQLAGGQRPLLDIYELALQNDAQLRAQEAQYLANLENENVALSALLPQINAGYGISGRDTESVSPQIVGFDPTGQPIIAQGTLTGTPRPKAGTSPWPSPCLISQPGTTCNRVRNSASRPKPSLRQRPRI